MSTNMEVKNEEIDDEDEVVEYICRRCPGKFFTAAEVDAHKLMHKKKKKLKKDNKRKREAAGRKAGSGKHAKKPKSEPVSEEPEFLSFVQIDPKSESVSSVVDQPDEPQPKIRSKKYFDETAITEWSIGTGS